MAKVIFQDEQGQNLNRYLITPTDGGAAFTADLTRAATITQQGTPYNKEVGDHFLQTEDGAPVQVLTCTKSGTVYALTGLTAAAGKVPVMFKTPTSQEYDLTFQAGDAVTINGTAYEIWARDGSTLKTGAWATDAIVTGIADVDVKQLFVEPSVQTGGYVRQTAAPSDTSLLWVDSANGNVMKYYNGTAWAPVPATWG